MKKEEKRKEDTVDGKLPSFFYTNSYIEFYCIWKHVI